MTTRAQYERRTRQSKVDGIVNGAKFANRQLREQWDDFAESVDVDEMLHRTLERFTEDGAGGHHIALHVLETAYDAWVAGIEHLRNRINDL